MNEPEREKRDIRAAARGLPTAGSCPPEERLVLFYTGRLDQTEEDRVREHLSRCPKCLETARDAREFLDAMRLPQAGKTRPDRARVLPWGVGMATAAAALVIFSIIWFRGSSVPIAIEIPPAPYSSPEVLDKGLIFREGTPAEGLASAMTSYVQGDFAAAERDLERYVAHRPADEQGRFFLGVTRLLNGRSLDAMRELDQVAQTAEEPLRGEARYYFALAALRAGEEGRAAVVLRQLVVQDGPRRAAAAELLKRFESHQGR